MERIRIYQLPITKPTVFLGYDETVQQFGGVLPSSYVCTFNMVGNDVFRNMEEVYTYFQEKPWIRSLSVSDVVEIKSSKLIEHGFYFCDTIGWKRLPDDFRDRFGRRHPKANVDMRGEPRWI